MILSKIICYENIFFSIWLRNFYPVSLILQSPSETRQWRTSAAITHIGVSIISSAITTVTAAIPLTYSTILPFSKFGWIIAINTSVAILFTLTVCPALLSTIAPAQFHKTWCSILRAVLITVTFVVVFVVILYGVSFAGIFIPGPDGEALFPQWPLIIPVEFISYYYSVILSLQQYSSLLYSEL